MRRFVFATVAVCAVVLAFASPAQAGGTAVLTYQSLGGPNVNVSDIIGSGLKSGTTANFGGIVVCNASSIAASVSSNPAAGGTAVTSLTTWTFGNCMSNIPNTTCASITVGNLPYSMTFNGSTGIVMISSPQFTLRFCTPLGMLTCFYATPTINSLYSNTDNSIPISVNVTKSSGPGVCPTSTPFTATYAPISDISVPAPAPVFVQ
jgi:hypothetical protein